MEKKEKVDTDTGVIEEIQGEGMADVTRVTPALVEKLVKAYTMLDNIKKDGRNEFSKYNYVTADALSAAVRDVLGQCGLILWGSVVGRETTQIKTANDKNSWQEDVWMSFSVTDGKGLIVFHVPGIGQDTGDKALYKAITGARKYAIFSLFNLGGEDAEKDSHKTSDVKKAATTPRNDAKRETATKPEEGKYPVMLYGAHKGEAIDTLDDEEISKQISYYVKGLGDPEKAKYRASNKKFLASLYSVAASRMTDEVMEAKMGDVSAIQKDASASKLKRELAAMIQAAIGAEQAERLVKDLPSKDDQK